jgi:hypothetical protein
MTPMIDPNKHSLEWRMAVEELINPIKPFDPNHLGEESSLNELHDNALLENHELKAEIKKLKLALYNCAFMLDNSRGKSSTVAQRDFVMLDVSTKLKKMATMCDIVSSISKEK